VKVRHIKTMIAPKSTPLSHNGNTAQTCTAMLNKGVEVKTCGTCINARGLDISDLVEDIERGSMKILVEWIRDSDKVISF